METVNPTPSPDVKALAEELAKKIAFEIEGVVQENDLEHSLEFYGQYVTPIITQALLQHGAATAQAMREQAAECCDNRDEHGDIFAKQIRALPLPSQTGSET